MLDGAARVADVVEAVAADGQPAVAITDHGNLYGAVDFTKAALAAGVKPIIGIEAYLTPGSRFDRPARRDDIRYHITLLAVNDVGYHNLIQLTSKSFLDGFYYKPRMDHELLAEHSEGIIAASGCLGGEVAQLLAPDAYNEEGNVGVARDFDAAVAAAARYQDIFGKDGFYIELMDHGVEGQRKVMPDLMEISRRIGAPLLATNDCHYTRAEEAEAHDALLCIQTGALMGDADRFRFNGTGYHVRTAAEMRRLFPDDSYPGACDNTLLIAEQAGFDMEFGQILLPQFPVPAGQTEGGLLRRLVMEGAGWRYGEVLPSKVTERIDYELRVIEDMGFPAYFLIVWDLMRHAREQGIRTGPGRGSAAGSIVAYCLRITDLDPLAYGLIFERFLNPGRRQMPDIDMDFDERYRGEMIRYVADRYGSDHVAQIVTFSTIKGRQAVRDAARVLGYPYGLGDRVAKAMPPAILGKEASLAQCLDDLGDDFEPVARDHYTNAAGLRDMYATDDDARRVLDTARGLEGLRRQDSIHAAAVVISPVPLTEIVPIQQKGQDAEIVTQFEMHAIEELGLLKMDFLGLRNLSTIERALELIEENYGERPDIDRVPLDDPIVYEMLSRGDSMGIFQMEGGGMRALMRNLGPDRFDDLIALISLYRPGPLGAGTHNMYAERKNGRAAVTYPHPDLEPVLGDSYGIMVYQEQVMEAARVMAGFSMVAADGLRKAMGKKIPAVMAEQEQLFVDGCVAQGHPAALGKELFDLISHFAGYGFNKSHAAGYAVIAYQTAWLKGHYPSEYMAALLTSSKRDKDRTAPYLNECRSMGVRVLVPDVNTSESDFVAREGMVTFGLSAVRNVGEGVVERIVEERRKNGPFTDFGDFVDRVDMSVLNKRTVESLIKAGAFDATGAPRRGLLLVHEQIIDAVVARRRAEDMGQYSLFGDAESTPGASSVEVPDLEWDKATKLAFEKEMLGLYVSDHPLFGAEATLRRLVTTSVAGLSDQPDKAAVSIGGIVGAITRRFTRKGETMLFFQLEDLEAATEVVCFPRTVGDFGPLVRPDAILVVTGRVDQKGDSVKLVAQAISEPTLETEAVVRLQVPAVRMSKSLVGRLRGVLGNHPGDVPVFLHLAGDRNTVVRLGDDFRVEPRTALYAELRELLGSGAVLS
ncbi:MAG: DNA polymerase III subunit alpha [Actinobacteria bacterium]|nr:DNA polymerase III subunit alpha [Actinomycetota bacterium]MBU1492905.1 DNA polymerase III subunit alpha [Actinomycetota bacterium]